MTGTIFVSHSTAKEDWPRLFDIKAALEAKTGLTVWLDKHELELGDEWYRSIERALAECSAGLVLLDGRAVASPYVLHEQTVLSYRSWTEPAADFRLFAAVIDPDFDLDVLEAAPWNATRVDSRQIVRIGQQDLPDLADRLATKVADVLGGPAPPPNRFGRLLAAIEDQLAEVSAKAIHRAIDAVEQMSGVPHPLRTLLKGISPASQRRQLTNWILERSAVDLYEVRALLRPLKNTQRGIDWKMLGDLVRAAEAYWLGDDVSSCPVDRQVKAPRGGLVAVNGKWVPNYTAECFAYRALWPDGRFVLLTCDDRSHSVDDVVEAIRAKLQEFGVSVPLNEDMIRRRAEQADPVICILPNEFVHGAAERERVEELRRRLGPVVFLTRTGLYLNADDLPPGVVPVVPAVDLVQEERHAGDWDGFRSMMIDGKAA